MDTLNVSVSVESLAKFLIEKTTARKRIFVAVVGAPGAGKSTIANRLSAFLNQSEGIESAILSMDGFHYDNEILDDLSIQGRKGALNTFDVTGLHEMLLRLKANNAPDIAVPVFDRQLDLSRASARFILSKVNLVLVEGNYLLLDVAPWKSLAKLFDTSVFIDVPTETLRSRLVERWQHYGIAQEDIAAKVEGNDLLNVEVVLKYSRAADYILIN